MGYLHLKDEPTQVYSYPLNEAPPDLDPRLEFSEGDVTLLFGGNKDGSGEPLPEGFTPWANVQLPSKPSGAEIAAAMAVILLAQPAEVQAQFVRPTVDIGYFLDKGNIGLAKVLLEGVPVPEELEPVKAALLVEINKGL